MIPNYGCKQFFFVCSTQTPTMATNWKCTNCDLKNNSIKNKCQACFTNKPPNHQIFNKDQTIVEY